MSDYPTSTPIIIAAGVNSIAVEHVLHRPQLKSGHRSKATKPLGLVRITVRNPVGNEVIQIQLDRAELAAALQLSRTKADISEHSSASMRPTGALVTALGAVPEEPTGAQVVPNPQANPYDPSWSSGLMVECRECGIEWGWSATREKLQGFADEHNRTVKHGAAVPAVEPTQPCKCHHSFAAITPTHTGHCCFKEGQTCHEAEVALWRAGDAARRGVSVPNSQ